LVIGTNTTLEGLPLNHPSASQASIALESKLRVPVTFPAPALTLLTVKGCGTGLVGGLLPLVEVQTAPLSTVNLSPPGRAADLGEGEKVTVLVPDETLRVIVTGS
jgi:hypothetical protein